MISKIFGFDWNCWIPSLFCHETSIFCQSSFGVAGRSDRNLRISRRTYQIWAIWDSKKQIGLSTNSRLSQIILEWTKGTNDRIESANDWLVGGLEHEWIIFPYIGNNSHIWLSYFSEGWAQLPTSWWLYNKKHDDIAYKHGDSILATQLAWETKIGSTKYVANHHNLGYSQHIREINLTGILMYCNRPKNQDRNNCCADRLPHEHPILDLHRGILQKAMNASIGFWGNDRSYPQLLQIQHCNHTEHWRFPNSS